VENTPGVSPKLHPPCSGGLSPLIAVVKAIDTGP